MKQELDLSPEFAAEWQGRDPFEAAFALEGEIFRKVKTRRTFRFELNGKGYFAKLHHGVGYREIIKNYLRFKRPVLGAQNEYRALKLLHEKKIDTMTPCAYGCRGDNPAKLDSFLITAELVRMTSLEDLCREWPANPPDPRLRQALTKRLAMSVKGMHDAGLNHRDCYLCHFLLDNASSQTPQPRLYIIDLHRAEIRPQVPYRYRVKDVAGIYFSSMDIGLTRKDILRFIKAYSGQSLRQTLGNPLWHAVSTAAHALYRKEQRRHSRP